MFITNKELNVLTEAAKASPRFLMNQDLSTSSGASSQRMLNVLKPDTFIPIHRHKKTSETIVMVKGALIERF